MLTGLRQPWPQLAMSKVIRKFMMEQKEVQPVAAQLVTHENRTVSSWWGGVYAASRCI